MASLLEFFKKGWLDFRELSPFKQVVYMMVMMGFLSGLTMAVLYSTRPNYQMLFSNLNSEDSGQIIAYLKDNKIPYKLSGGGSAIQVPSKDVYEIRMSLANEGMPLGGTSGWELFDNKSMGMTDFEQRVNYQRALQGELVRTITQISKVDKARVHLVLPEDALFEEDKVDSTASVIVQMKNGMRLEKNEVQSIVYLVSSAVESLKPANITIMDSKGLVLTKPPDEEELGANNSIYEFKRTLEREKEKQILDLLGRTIGRDKIVASVTAEIGMTRVKKLEEAYDPDGQVVRSEQTSSDQKTGKEVKKSTAPGMSANAPDAELAESDTQNTNQADSKQQTINYEISKIVSEEVTPAGLVERLSIAVILDGKYEAVEGETDENGKAKLKYIAWNKKEIETFEDIVKNAVGFNAKRGDQIEVANIPFRTETWKEDELFVDNNKEFITTLISYGVILLGALAFFFLVLRPLIRWLTTEEEPITDEELEKLIPGRVVDLEEKLLEGGGEMPMKEKTDENPVDEMRKQLQERRKTAIENARRNRKAISMMVRKWLKEDVESRSQKSN